MAIYNTLDVLAPLQKITIRPKARPWVTPELRSAIRSRDRAYRRARRHPTASRIASYKESRSTVRNMLDTAKNKIFKNKNRNCPRLVYVLECPTRPWPIAHALSRPLRKRLDESMIFATFDYGSSVFYDLNKEQSLQLHRLHNACVRFVYGTIPHTELMSPRIVWHWVGFQHKGRRDYNIIVLAINVISRQSPKPLSGLFTFRANRLLHRAARRQPPRELTHKAARTQALHNSFAYTATRLINNLPCIEDPRHPPRSFKEMIRAHLFHQDVQDWKKRCSDENLEYELYPLRNRLPPM
ncbi:unnamed protein product [Trichogramma brassicae]|uniref:Uncharacterized protein n=1 Tax=Trichogramma brassicae TaxID=86971 RepID=A0A6H5J4Y2_9HYME|nr:unnamed protein product [Trichogramma brassicae]